VCATDAGREGELIFRYIYEATASKKPVSRLWISSLTPDSIRILFEREKRVEKFSLRPLTPSDRERYAEDWAAIQRRFVDDSSNAVSQADTLVNTVLAARGYPVGEAE
jgi:hypothetical protein